MLKTLFSLSTLSVLGYLLALINQMVITNQLGTSEVLDSFYYALTINSAFYFYSSAFTEAAVPGFFNLQQADRSQGARYFSQVINTMVLISFFFCLISLAISGPLTSFLIGDKNPEHASRIVHYLRFLVLMIPIGLMTNVLTGILNSQGKFISQQVAKALGTIVSVLVTWLFIKQYNAMVLVITMQLAALMLLGAQIYEIKKDGMAYVPGAGILRESKFYKVFISLSASALLIALVLIFEKWTLDQFGQGAIAAYGHSQKLFQVGVQILIGSLTTIVWTRFMNIRSTGGDDQAIADLIKIASWSFSITIVISAAVFTTATPLLYLLFFGGRFTLESLRDTAHFFQYAMFAIPLISVYSIAIKYLLTIRHAKLLGLTNFILTAGLGGSIFYAYRSHDLFWVATSQIVAYAVATVVLLMIIRRMAMQHVFRELIKQTWRWVSWALVCLALGYFLTPYLQLEKGQLLWKLPLVYLLFFAPVLWSLRPLLARKTQTP